MTPAIQDYRGKTPTLILEKVRHQWQIRHQFTGKTHVIGPRKPAKPYLKHLARRMTQ